MNSRIECPHCKRSLTVSDKLAGRGGQCPHCSGKFRIPAVRQKGPAKDCPPVVKPPAAALPPAVEAPPVETPWMFMQGGKITGPVSPMQLSQLCQSGQIAVDCAVFHVPSGRWMQLNTIPGMFPPAYPSSYVGWGAAPAPPLPFGR